MENFLIVGVDPGTTLGYAIIDLDCNVQKMSSGKMIGLNKLIKIISDIGLPLIVATDKAVVPGFIEKLNAKLGTRIYSPKNDLQVIEKKSITKKYLPKRDHERDSLAAALFAYKSIRPLIAKTDRFVIKENKERLKNQLRRLMILQQGKISLQSAVGLLESSGKKQKVTLKKILKKKDFTTEYFNLREEYVRLKKKHMLVLAQRDRLLGKKTTEPKIKIKEVTIDPNLKKRLKYKDKKLRLNSLEIKRIENLLREEKNKKNLLKKFLMSKEEYFVIKIVENFGKSSVKLKRGDILYIKDPVVSSQKTIEHIKKYVDIIITAKKTDSTRQFIVLNPKNLNMTLVEDIAIVKKKELDKILDKRLLLKKILKEHKSLKN